MSFIPTSELIKTGSYFDSPKSFFGLFSSAWDGVRSQVLKYESRQQYIEQDSESWRAWMERGDWPTSMNLLEESRSVDVPLYESLKVRGIDFIRCHPVSFPLSKYMKWEFEVYKFNEKHGERIFCANSVAVSDFMHRFAQHDFMVFDGRIAAIHHYDADGLVVGGWWTQDSTAISELIKIHGFIKSNCRPFKLFYEANEARIGKRDS